MSKQAEVKPENTGATPDYGDDFTPDVTTGDDDFSGIINTDATIEVDRRLLEDEQEAEAEAEAEAEVEPEAETEATVEAEAEPESKPEPEPRIPKRRLDKVIEQRNQLDMRLKEVERELAEARKAQAKEAEVSEEQLIAWNNEANKALLDGDLEKAAEIQKKVFAALRTKPQETEQVNVDDLKTKLKDELRVEQKLETVYRDHPELDPNSETYSEDLLDEAIELQDYYFSRGAPLVEAIDKAISMLKREGKLRGAEPAKPKPAYRETKPDVAAKAALAARQPREPASSRRTEADLQPDVATLSIEEYAALSETQKARLRGDFL